MGGGKHMYQDDSLCHSDISVILLGENIIILYIIFLYLHHKLFRAPEVNLQIQQMMTTSLDILQH